MSDEALTEPARLLLLASLLASDRIISNNGKAFLKEMILRRDPRLGTLLARFESREHLDAAFMEQVHDIIQNEAQSAYNELFSDTSLEVGKSLSKEERDRLSLNEEKSLIYGEVEFKSFYRILRKINAPANTTFYDLGSGTGKAVFAARFTYDFAKCIGIEILQGLHNQAFKITSRYNQEFRNVLCSAQRQHAAVYKGSFVEYDWSDGDVVFANSTCFDDDLMAALSRKAEALKPGAIVVTFTKGLSPARCFELLEKKRQKMSWGPATVYIHRRLNADGSSTGAKKLNTLPSDDKEYDEDDNDQQGAGSSSEEEEEDEDEEDEEDDDEDEDEEDYDSEEDDESYSDSEDEDEDEDEDYVHIPPRPSYAWQQHQLFQQQQQQQQQQRPQTQPASLTSPRRPTPSGLDEAGLNSPQDSALMQRKFLRGGGGGGGGGGLKW